MTRMLGGKNWRRACNNRGHISRQDVRQPASESYGLEPLRHKRVVQVQVEENAVERHRGQEMPPHVQVRVRKPSGHVLQGVAEIVVREPATKRDNEREVADSHEIVSTCWNPSAKLPPH